MTGITETKETTEIKVVGLSCKTQRGMGRIIEQNMGYVSVAYSELGQHPAIETLPASEVELCISTKKEAWLVGSRIDYTGQFPKWMIGLPSDELDYNAYLKLFFKNLPFITAQNIAFSINSYKNDPSF